MTPLPHYGSMSIPISPEKYPGKIGRKMPIFPWKNALIASGGVGLLALLLLSAPVAAQQITPTPIPQVVATQQAASDAAAQVNNLQAQRAQVQAQLDEINRNIEAQIAEAERAAADARTAAAAQNAVESGAAIGRLEGALDQLRASYAGKDRIVTDLTARNEQQAAQIISDTQTIDHLSAALQVAQQEKQTTLTAYYALQQQREDQATQDTILNLAKLFALIVIFVLIIAGVISVVQRKHTTVVVEQPKQAEQAEIIEGEVTHE